MENVRVTRREALGIGGAVAAGIGLAGVGNAQADEAAPWLPESWDYEADIVVVGYGGAGLAAAITAYDEDLGSVIMLEAAPEEFRGGNTRVCGQNILIPEDPAEAVKYQRALNGIYKLDEDPQVEEELYQAWANALHENKEWLEELGANVTATAMNSHEFPELDGCERGATCYLIDNTVGQGALWNFLEGEKNAREIETHYDTRAVELVRNPMTNEALGVVATKGEDTLYFKASKGVILACGGFENNEELMNTYFMLGSPITSSGGTPYNRGDGFKMVAPFGAKLRCMNNVMGPYIAYEGCGAGNWIITTYNKFSSNDYIYVGPNGKRFISEDYQDSVRHSKVLVGGVYACPQIPSPSWTVFGQKCFDAGDIVQPFTMGWQNVIGHAGVTNQDYLDAGVIVRADTVEELAEKIELDPTVLAETVATYNQYCADGFDLDFKRGAAGKETGGSADNARGLDVEGAKEGAVSEGYELLPIEGPFYAMRNRTSAINTQGGPKRGVGCEVIDVNERPVPRLFSTGEFGTVYAYQYNGGGNVSDAIASGRVAARSAGALEPWA